MSLKLNGPWAQCGHSYIIVNKDTLRNILLCVLRFRPSFHILAESHKGRGFELKKLQHVQAGDTVHDRTLISRNKLLKLSMNTKPLIDLVK